MRIAILADNPLLVDELPQRLRADGHRVRVHPEVRDLVARVVAEGGHLVIVEAALCPGLPLLDLCRMLRRESSALLLLVGQTESVSERVQALDAGADAYLTHPIDRDEVHAHMRALLRRHPLSLFGRSSGSVRVTRTLSLDLVGQRLVGEGKEGPLTDRECRLLLFLVRHEGAVLSREALLNAVWGYDEAVSDREVDVYIRYLRQKLEPDPAHPRYLLTVCGRGYQYQGPHTVPKMLEVSNKASATGTQGLPETPVEPIVARIGRERILGQGNHGPISGKGWPDSQNGSRVVGWTAKRS